MQLGWPLLAVLWSLTGAIALFAALPSLYSLCWALYGTDTVGVLASKPSGRWFHSVLSNPDWQQALYYSIALGIASSVFSATALLVHFYFARYASATVDRISYGFVIVAALVPAVVYALAMRSLEGSLLLPESLFVFVGHVILVLPVQYFVLESCQEAVSSQVLYAGNVLGANHMRNLLYVYFPLMRGPLVSTVLMGFFVSFDELVFATFVIDSPLVTVPRKLWDQVHHSMEPAPAVIASLLAALFAAYLVVWLVLRSLRRQRTA